MDLRPAGIPEIVLIEPRVIGDSRGFFLESFDRTKL